LANYKRYATSYISCGGLNVPVPADETIKVLHQPTILTTVGQSYHDSSDVNYQVPTGKKYKIYGVLMINNTSNKTITIEQSDAADTSTNGVQKAKWFFIGGGGSAELAISPATVLADKYINAKISNAAAPYVLPLLLYGTESDA